MTHTATDAAVLGLTPDDVRQAVADILGMTPEAIDHERNLISYGMDSMRMMRLAGAWRKAGATTTFRDLAEEPTVERWHALLTAGPATPASVVPAQRPARRSAGDPFALTPVQQAYWIGRGQGMTLGSVACHAYLEFDGQGVDRGRLESAVRAVIARHPMLRARFLDDGRQQILADSGWTGLTVHDFTSYEDKDARRRAEEVREGLSHRVLDVAAAETLDVQLSLLPAGRTRIHFNIDLLVADVASIELVLADLATAYTGTPLPAAPAYDFGQYLEDHRSWCGPLTAPDSPAGRARAYWQEQLPQLPAQGPALPLAVRPEQVTRSRFSRRRLTLGKATWESITERAREYSLTPAMVLATAYAQVLAAWSETDDFLLNVPLFDRQPLAPEVPGMVADFTNLVLLRVDAAHPMPFADRARVLQRQLQQNASHAEYSTLNVLRDLRRARRDKRVGAPVVFACNLDSQWVGPEFEAALGEWTWMLSQTPQVWLDHQVYKVGDEVVLAWDAVDELFPEGLIDTMLDAYGALLEELAAQPDSWSRPPRIASPEQLPEVAR
ncbi:MULTISPECIES: condensation domain-containing protein [unclassified Streptomyces]|uniref:condensation domain-containing protein n=1 Tax=unclassified Streptomyces TaxID=2593676 RepID=UPI002E139665|nr:condensation domain-containing protein [Streptomyces sp. NBC_01241]WSP61217.1 condensation domain-containing protein [Streptomyces sp. NBC_01240]